MTKINDLKSAQDEIDEMTVLIEQNFRDLERRSIRTLIAVTVLISALLITLIFQ